LVGFPGETDREFQELMDFLTDADFEHVGVFAFSREEGTPAAEMPNQVDEETKTHRHLAMLHHLDKLARRTMARHLDTRTEAIIDGASEVYPDFMKGRTWRQGIDVDGVTYVRGRGAKAGRIVPIRIFDYKDQDFFAEVAK
jgi:tRNA A37 methylthiotransferase MiaB